MNSRTKLSLLLVCAVIYSEASPRAELRLCLPDEPKTFDPLQVTEESSQIVQYLTGGTLVRVDRMTDEVRAELAESWTIDKTGKSITFRLRPGLKFSDGTPLNANDVARTLREAFDPQRASPAGDVFRSERGLPAIDVLSPLEIAIRYPAPKAGLDRLFDEFYVAPASTSRVSSRMPASAGPFSISEYRPGVALLLKRNPWYWKHDSEGRALPYLDSIRLEVQPNYDIQVVRFLRGEIDILKNVAPEEFEQISKQKPTAARDMGPSLDSEFLWFNQAPSGMPEWKRNWFTSAAFRHAISESINRADLARIAYHNHAAASAGPLSKANKFWFNRQLAPLPHDPDSAMRTLRAEGFTRRANGLFDKEGHPVEFSVITNAGNRPRQAMAALIQADLAEIGVRVNIVTLDMGALVDRIARSSQYEACLLGFAGIAPDPSDQMNFWLSSGPQHAWWPSQKAPVTAWEARIDQLVLAQASEPSRDSRRKAFNEVQRILVDQEPVIYLVNPDCLSAVSPSLGTVGFSALFPQALSNVETLRVQ
jgi:peptide/nickel transport system substrate-binding protein